MSEKNLGAVLPVTRICANLVFDAASTKTTKIFVQPSVAAPLAALAAELERLERAIGQEIAAAPRTEKEIWNTQVYSPNESTLLSWSKAALYNTFSTPQPIVDFRARIEQLVIRFPYVQRLRKLATDLLQVPALAAAISYPVNQTGEPRVEHPDEDLEEEMGEWFLNRAAESIHSLMKVIYASDETVTSETRERSKHLLSGVEGKAAAYLAYLSAKRDPNLRNPLQREFFEHSYGHKMKEVGQWALQEFGHPMEPTTLRELVGMLLVQDAFIIDRLNHLSWLHSQIPGEERIFQRRLVRLAQVVLNGRAQFAEAAERLKQITVEVARSRMRLELSPEQEAVLAQLSLEFGKSAPQVVHDLVARYSSYMFSNNPTFSDKMPKEALALLLLRSDYLKKPGFDHATVLMPDARRWITGIADEGFDRELLDLYVAYLVVVSQERNLQPREVVSYAQELIREDMASDKPTGYTWADWFALSAYGLSIGMPQESMFTLVHMARDIRGRTVSVSRAQMAMDYAMDTVPAGQRITPQVLAEFLHIPCATQSCVFNRLAQSSAGDAEVVLAEQTAPLWRFNGLTPDAALAALTTSDAVSVVVSQPSAEAPWVYLPLEVNEADAFGVTVP